MKFGVILLPDTSAAVVLLAEDVDLNNINFVRMYRNKVVLLAEDVD